MVATNSRSPSALLITGSVGAGKTSVAELVGGLLAEAEVPHAVIDLDWLRNAWPSPPGDRFNFAMELRNLRDVVRNFMDAGAVRLVLAGVVETQADLDRYRATISVPLTICRLRVDLPVLRARLTRRHEDGQALRWHLDRSGELDAILEAVRLEDFSVEASKLTAYQVAEIVLDAAGWMAPPAG